MKCHFNGALNAKKIGNHNNNCLLMENGIFDWHLKRAIDSSGGDLNMCLPAVPSEGLWDCLILDL